MTKIIYSIEFRGLDDLTQFVSTWSAAYSYPLEEKYNNNIVEALDSKYSFIELFRWKNGTGDVIYEKKMDVVLRFWDKVDVLRQLRHNFTWDSQFDWQLFEDEFQPQGSSAIWKLFLLHLRNVHRFPILDQHVFRAYTFFKTGEIKEIPSRANLKYQFYKSEYLGWFNQHQKQYNIPPKKLDESLFTFGRMLKRVSGYPYRISKSSLFDAGIKKTSTI